MSWSGICARCGAAFVTRRSRGMQAHCSPECGYAARRESNLDPAHLLERLDLRSESADRGYETGCLTWTGPRNNRGYGYITVDGRKVLVHRLAYELLVGPIPTGLTIDHLCRQKDCREHTHLEPVTERENYRRGQVRSRGVTA